MSLCQGYFAKSRWASHPESRSGKKGIRIFHRPLKKPFNKVRYNDKDAPLASSGAFCTKGRGGGEGIQRKRGGGGVQPRDLTVFRMSCPSRSNPLVIAFCDAMRNGFLSTVVFCLFLLESL